MEVITGIFTAFAVLAVLVYICLAFVALSMGWFDRDFRYDNAFPPILAFWYDVTYNVAQHGVKWSDRNDARHEARLAAKASK